MHESSALSPTTEPRPRGKKSVWAGWTDDKLLDVRICDLGVTINETPLERRIADLN